MPSVKNLACEGQQCTGDGSLLCAGYFSETMCYSANSIQLPHLDWLRISGEWTLIAGNELASGMIIV